ncbi:MAG TPA: CaiB/BaiF CoA-transferase family protein [Solirubrobacteraceae bacterium]|nr:CaiB/BaiF CoA-transferase family protein [Solirubrobacteraceae bacterium]
MTGLPLAGLRVLDLTRLLPGGFCSLLLADFGADVIKVEDTGAGDYVRWAPPHYEGAEPSAGSALFLSLNRGKRSIRIDLKSAAGKDVLLRLVREVDVLIESFRPGVMDRLGVGYERLAEENHGLVYCAITGYGQDGPNRGRPGHDINYLGLNGILGLTGEADGPPVSAAAQIADLGGGALMGVAGILIALRERALSGQGQLVDCSMFDGSLSFLAMLAGEMLADGNIPRRGELRLAGGLVCYRPYRCADGYVTLGALEPKFWAEFCRGAGREDLLDHAFDPPGSDAHRAVCDVFAARTRAEWEAFAGEHDCCLEPVLGLDEALDGDLVAAREMVVELDQPGARQPVRLLGVPFKLSRTPADPVRAPGPALGEHTHEVLAEAGYTPEEIDALLESGAVAGPAPDTVQSSFMA